MEMEAEEIASGGCSGNGAGCRTRQTNTCLDSIDSESASLNPPGSASFFFVLLFCVGCFFFFIVCIVRITVGVEFFSLYRAHAKNYRA